MIILHELAHAWIPSDDDFAVDCQVCAWGFEEAITALRSKPGDYGTGYVAALTKWQTPTEARAAFTKWKMQRLACIK